MNFNVDNQGNYLSPDAVDSNHAAAGLGTSRKTLMRLRRLGLIPAFSVPSRIPGRVMWRYRMEDLMAFKKTQRNQIHAWDPRADAELPAIVIARMTMITTSEIQFGICNCLARIIFVPTNPRMMARPILR